MPVRVKFTTKGMEKALEALAEAGKNVDATAQKMLAAGAEVLLEGMQQRVPVDTGNLKDNLSIDGPHQDGHYHYVFVGINQGADADTVRYGTVQEYGSADTPAQPYIRPTVDNDTRKARAAAMKVAREALKE